jgi:hypothetical protein
VASPALKPYTPDEYKPGKQYQSDEELIKLKDEWEQRDSTYSPKIKPRQEANKIYYQGKQRANGMAGDRVVSSNLIFESEETFIPQALRNIFLFLVLGSYTLHFSCKPTHS